MSQPNRWGTQPSGLPRSGLLTLCTHPPLQLPTANFCAAGLRFAGAPRLAGGLCAAARGGRAAAALLSCHLPALDRDRAWLPPVACPPLQLGVYRTVSAAGGQAGGQTVLAPQAGVPVLACLHDGFGCVPPRCPERSQPALPAPPPRPPPPCSIAAAMPLTAEWAAGKDDPQAQCLMLNAHALLLCNVALPLLVLWHLEAAAQRRFAAEQAHAAAAQLADGGSSEPQSALQALLGGGRGHDGRGLHSRRMQGGRRRGGAAAAAGQLSRGCVSHEHRCVGGGAALGQPARHLARQE